LLKTLQDEYPKARGNGIMCLGRFGPLAKPAVPALIEVLKKGNWDTLRMAAAEALGNIGPAAAEAIPALLAAGREEDDLCLFAAEALARVGAGNEEVRAALVAMVWDRSASPRRRCGAIWGLGRLGTAGRPAVPALLEVLRTPYDPESRAEHRGRPKAEKDGWPARWLDDAKLHPEFGTDVRGCALIALWRIGSGAAEAAPMLLDLCADEKAEPFERWVAAVDAAPASVWAPARCLCCCASWSTRRRRCPCRSASFVPWRRWGRKRKTPCRH